MRFHLVFLAAIIAITSSASDTASTEGTTSATTPTPPTTTASTTTSTTPVAPTTTSSTTAAPTTTTPTTPSPSPTPSPTPPKGATLGKYSIKDNDTYCLLFWAKITVQRNNSFLADVVNGTVVTTGSSCGKDKITLFVEWETDNHLEFVIKKANSSFFIANITVEAQKVSANKGDLEQFSTSLDSYYKCTTDSAVDLKENDISLVFSDMKFLAFGEQKKEDFLGKKEVSCQSDTHNDVVIIAVGCAMALLVVIILVAYLIARRRNRQRGYQSV